MSKRASAVPSGLIGSQSSVCGGPADAIAETQAPFAGATSTLSQRLWKIGQKVLRLVNGYSRGTRDIGESEDCESSLTGELVRMDVAKLYAVFVTCHFYWSFTFHDLERKICVSSLVNLRNREPCHRPAISPEVAYERRPKDSPAGSNRSIRDLTLVAIAERPGEVVNLPCKSVGASPEMLVTL